MRSGVAAFLLAAALVLAGAAVSTLPRLAREDTVAMAPHGPREAGSPDHGGAHAWSGGTGAVPDLTTALLHLERRGDIRILNDSQFNPANGVRSGSGTFDDPFVISGWHVGNVLIKDTTKAFVLRESWISGTLVLDWTGAGGYVHHNHIQNLRTNRNVERVGDPSASVIERNVILRVEELRHFDGEVRNNTIGHEGLPRLGGPEVVLNIAGLNGAGIHDNVIFGGVDMKIHGHHHGDRPGARSHNHGAARSGSEGADVRSTSGADDAQAEDHQVRHVDFAFYRNRIVDDRFGLRYNDADHAGDDRTATSEQEPDLEKPHVHHTTVRIHDNVIEGATLRISILNAPDERHLPGETALLEIARNAIRKPGAGDGIVVASVRNAVVRVVENDVERGGLQLSGSSAVLLRGFANSTVLVGGNTFGEYRYGVRATGFDALTRWVVLPNDGAAKQPVHWDSSVENPPERADGATHGHGGHAHATAPEDDAVGDAGFDIRNTSLM